MHQFYKNEISFLKQSKTNLNFLISVEQSDARIFVLNLFFNETKAIISFFKPLKLYQNKTSYQLEKNTNFSRVFLLRQPYTAPADCFTHNMPPPIKVCSASLSVRKCKIKN